MKQNYIEGEIIILSDLAKYRQFVLTSLAILSKGTITTGLFYPALFPLSGQTLLGCSYRQPFKQIEN